MILNKCSHPLIDLFVVVSGFLLTGPLRSRHSEKYRYCKVTINTYVYYLVLGFKVASGPGVSLVA